MREGSSEGPPRSRGGSFLPRVPVDHAAGRAAALDPIAAMAVADQEKLRELLSDVELAPDLEAYLREIAGDDSVIGPTDPNDVPEVPDEPCRASSTARIETSRLWMRS